MYDYPYSIVFIKPKQKNICEFPNRCARKINSFNRRSISDFSIYKFEEKSNNCKRKKFAKTLQFNLAVIINNDF